jgi:hypothetical protein
MAAGFGLIAIGAAWYVFSFGWLYSLIIILLVIAVLAIAGGLRRR